MPSATIGALVAGLAAAGVPAIAATWASAVAQSPRPAGTSTAIPTTADCRNPKSDSRLIATARSACSSASSQRPATYSARAR